MLVLAVRMALLAKDVSGKILAIFFPIMAFVAMGFDHVVADVLPPGRDLGRRARRRLGQHPVELAARRSREPRRCGGLRVDVLLEISTAEAAGRT
jgi:hypothetical protein